MTEKVLCIWNHKSNIYPTLHRITHMSLNRYLQLVVMPNAISAISPRGSKQPEVLNASPPEVEEYLCGAGHFRSNM